MKFCAIICEYNPLHNGHLYQLQEAKRRSGADALLCIMSGNFVQRGESAVLNKYTRALHAIMAGADIVIELPTIFATSNAEVFAKGAISILSSIPAVSSLCFGAEQADKTTFLHAAKCLNDEPKAVSEKLKENIALGMSYAKARANAWSDYLPIDLLCSPNNILGLEYTRAILETNANIDIIPIQRIGGGYNDVQLQETYSSASAIRTAITQGTDFSKSLPLFVKQKLPLQLENQLDTLEKYSILARSKKDIASVLDCNEGLENAFKKAALQKETLSESLTSARYTASRIRRIALQNLLGIEEQLIFESLKNPLYLRILAIKKERSELLSILSHSHLPVIARAHDETSLCELAKKAYEIDVFAENIYNLLYPTKTNKTIFI